ncbi:hypothetical protein PWR63_01850 [Paraburkholderia sp. A2WS-5]|uniref:hypothetical protein n=1 Tax=unclassified Paraburkholderia TaxID=2615204 RepID=UPI003B82A325
MNRRRAPHIPQKRQIYIGCEGASEVGYAALLQDFINEAGLPVHLKIDELAPGAGDPLARVELAVMRIGMLAKKRIAPAAAFVLLDTDQIALDQQRANRARRLAIDNDITIVWQESCFEAVLLRHLPNRAANRPPDSRAAEQAITREWPEYEKPMSRAALARRITLDSVLQAAGVEPDLAGLLRSLELLA